MLDVLRLIASGWRKPGHLQMRANLDYKRTTKVLATLERLGYIRREGSITRVEWALTDKGAKWVRSHLDALNELTGRRSEFPDGPSTFG